MTYSFDPVRRALVVAEPRLTKLLQREPESCASVSEYAVKAGIETGQIIELFGPAVDSEVLTFEIVGEEIFVNTAPKGRPTPAHLPEVAPNLWERLRTHGSPEEAYSLWRMARGLERAGWKVEANPNRIMFGLSRLPAPPALGLAVQASMVPLILHPTIEQVSHASGLLTMFDEGGAASVGIVCDSGALDEHITAVRRWGFSRLHRTGMAVVLLEAPRYNPTLLTPGDASVAPRSVSIASMSGPRRKG